MYFLFSRLLTVSLSIALILIITGVFVDGTSFTPLQKTKTTTTVAFAQAPNATAIKTSNITTQNSNQPSVSPTSNDSLFVTAINVGDNQSDVAVNPKTNKVYVTLSDKPILSVIDGGTNKVIKNITVGKDPTRLAVNPNNNTIYVGGRDNSTTIINGYNNNKLTTIHLSKTPSIITANPITNKVYIGYFDLPEISIIDGITNSIVKNITLDTKPSTNGITHMAINPNTNLIYAIRNGNFHTVSVVDGNTDRLVKNITLKDVVHSLAVDPGTNLLYVTQLGRISVIDGNTNNIVKNIIYDTPPFDDPFTLAINPSTKVLYVSDSFNDVWAIDTTSNVVVGNVTLSQSPEVIAINPITNTVYTAANEDGDNHVSMIKENNTRPLPTAAVIPNNNTTTTTIPHNTNIQTDYLTLFKQGTQLLNSGNYTGAISAYDKALSLDPNHAAGWNNRGEALGKLGRHDAALESYDKALAIDPTIALIWNNRGFTLYNLGKYNESIAAYAKAISLEPNNTMFQQNRDIVLKHTGLTSATTNTNNNNNNNMTGLSQPQPGNVTNPSRASLPPSSAPMLNYENPTFGIRMQYPSNWIANETVDRIVNGTKVVEFDTPTTGFSNNLILFVRQVNNNKDSISWELLGSIETDSFNPGYKILEANTNATLSKQPAYLLVDSTTNANGVTSILREIGTIIGDKVYIVQFFADSADYFTYVPTVNKMIDSVVITPSNTKN